jgi:acetyltransferase-like isoleucine patch superfamily enzyme
MNIHIERIGRAILAFPEWFITYFPGPLGRFMRLFYWRWRMAYVGKGVTFGVGVQISNPKYVRIGDNTWIDDYVVILAGPVGEASSRIKRKINPNYGGEEGCLTIGINCHIAQFVTLQAHGGLFVGDNTGIASGGKVYSVTHYHGQSNETDNFNICFKFSPRAPANEQFLVIGPVVMQNSTALGVNSVILPGSTIREGAWVGAMSVVSGEIPPYCVAVGTPAKKVKNLRIS